jgi:hypothetical protein
VALGVSIVGLAYAGNNPLPTTGAPHGTGISHTQYPNGYKLNGQFAATFNNYIDYSDGSPKDERAFLGARVYSPTSQPADGSFETRKKLQVKPGDKIIVSAYIHNDGGTSGNLNGSGPSVAKNTRIYFAFPTGQSKSELQLSSYIRANNAVVNDQNSNMHTVSDNMSFISTDGKPIKLKYVPGKARLLQTNMAKDPNNTNYQIWNFSNGQEYFMFTGSRTNVGGNTEEDPALGLPIGSNGSYQASQSVGTTQSQQLDWFGCNEYHGYVQFQVEVEAGDIPTPTPTPTTTPTVTPTPTPTPTHTPTPTPTPTETPCVEKTPGPTASPTPSPTPTPEECVSPTPSASSTPTPPSPPETPSTPIKGGTLPVTGTSTMALLSAIALAISGYLYIRERKALKQAIARYTVGK